MRGIWTRLSDDEGMTLVEVVVSAAIMFIILTGVLGLVGQTTLMGLQAKEKNILTNSVNAYIEWVHSLPFEDVALVDDGGVLSAETSETIGGYTVVIHPTVTDVSGNSALKNLRVDVEIIDGRGEATTHSTQVVVRDRSQFLTQPMRSPETDPQIHFIGLTPPSGSVVWGSEWSGGGLYLDVSADASEGRTIKIVRVSFGGIACQDATEPTPRTAVWTPDVQNWTSTGDLFAWNTLQTESVEQEDGGFIDVYLVADGMRTLKAWCVDSEGIEDSEEIYLLVDNWAPDDPASITGVAKSASLVALTWGRCADGGWGADSYDVEWVMQGMEDTEAAVDPFETWNSPQNYDWLNAAEFPSETMTYEAPSIPFSRYAARVRAVSPYPNERTSDWASTTYISRPLLTGTYAITRYKVSGQGSGVRTVSTLSVTPPAFPTTGTTTYTWYRSIGTAAPTQLAYTTATITDTCNQIVTNDNANWLPVKYYVVINYTASGYAGAAGTAKSNTVATLTGLATPTPTMTYAVGTW